MQKSSGPPSVLIIRLLIFAGGSVWTGVGGERMTGAALFGVGAFLGEEGFEWVEVERGLPLPLYDSGGWVFGFLSVKVGAAAVTGGDRTVLRSCLVTGVMGATGSNLGFFILRAILIRSSYNSFYEEMFTSVKFAKEKASLQIRQITLSVRYITS